jgi:aminopeptidase N
MLRFCAVVLFCSLGAAVAATQPQSPDLPYPDGNLHRLDWENKRVLDKGPEDGDYTPGSERYDILRSELNLRLDTAAGTVAGEVKHVFASLDDTLQTVILDLADGHGLTVSAVTGTGGPLPFEHAADALRVRLPAALLAGAVDSVTVTYGGVPSSPALRRGLWLETYRIYQGAQVTHEGPIFATMSQPAYAKYWWPCKDRPDDKIDHLTIRCTVPEGLTAAAPGLLADQGASEPGWTTFTWIHTYPIASYLVSVAVSDYVVWQDDCATPLGTNMPLQHFVYPGHVDSSYVLFGRTCEMIAACEEWFGSYPFGREKYGHAEFTWGGAMEHQTCTSFGATFFGSPRWSQRIVVHELAHQWFGNSVTPRTWADIWLNEGLATYSEALWFEYEGGSERYHEYMRLARPESDWVGQGPVYDPVPVFPGRIIYDKGAWIIHMLRGRLADDPAFFQLLQDWTQAGDRAFGTVTTEEFIAHCAIYAGEDLAAFFWPYLTTDDVPRVYLRHELAADGNGGATVTLTLRQTQAAAFDNIYPIHLELNGDQVVVERLRLDGPQAVATVTLPAGAALQQVRLDPQRWVLWRAAAGTSEQPRLTSVYPNPVFDQAVVFAYQLTATSTVDVAVYDVKGRRVFERSLGRVVPDPEANTYTWNSRTAAGGRAPAGVYWAAVTIDGSRSVRKFTLLH